MKPAASTTSKIAAAVNELTQGGHRVALPAADLSEPINGEDRSAETATPPGDSEPRPGLEAEEHSRRAAHGAVRGAPRGRKRADRAWTPTKETLVRIPQSFADVVEQLSGPEVREPERIQRTVFFTPEALAMADELADHFHRDRSMIVRSAIAYLHATLRKEDQDADLFPVR